jgi:hypothetical protein
LTDLKERLRESEKERDELAVSLETFITNGKLAAKKVNEVFVAILDTNIKEQGD